MSLPASRESWDDYFLKLAFMAASRATCPRRKVGAVLVQAKRVRGTGYNGSPANTDSCMDPCGCLMRDGSCVRTIHAEANVILSTDHGDRHGASVYCTDRPCLGCANLLANSGIREVVFARDYHRDHELTTRLFAQASIVLRHHPMDESVIDAVLGKAAGRGEPVGA